MSVAFMSVKDVFDKMPEAFQASAAGGVNIVFQFNVEGPGGGDWYVTVKEGACAVVGGVLPLRLVH